MKVEEGSFSLIRSQSRTANPLSLRHQAKQWMPLSWAEVIPCSSSSSDPPLTPMPNPRPTLPLHSYSPCGARTPTMPLLRPMSSRLITAPRARLQITLYPSLRTQQRPLSSTAARSAGDHAHEDHYDPPSGWLFGVKPGEKYENEGWENVWYYGFFGSLLFGVVGYCYKPDTR